MLSFFPWKITHAEIQSEEAERAAGSRWADEFVNGVGGLALGTLAEIVSTEEFDPRGVMEVAFLTRVQQRLSFTSPMGVSSPIKRNGDALKTT